MSSNRIKVRIKKNDLVEVISGKERGKRGKVLKVFPESRRVIVERINFIKKHQRPTQNYREGGVIEREGMIQVSNLMVVCPRCDRPVRLGCRELGEGRTVRICRRCEESVDKG